MASESYFYADLNDLNLTDYVAKWCKVDGCGDICVIEQIVIKT
jgi:hypothetical protein